MESANGCNLSDYPEQHDQPGQQAAQLPTGRAFHHRQRCKQRAASHDGHQDDARKIQAVEVCVLNPPWLLWNHSGHESESPTHCRNAIEQQ
jgi:hypothetical protein